MPTAGSLLRNLRSFHYVPPHPVQSIWPPGRRSAVLVLLFVGARGELRVLLTRRSRNLRSFSGQVSLPGGKADDDVETFEQVARREAEEEIGLLRNPELLASQYRMTLENVNMEFPCYMSRTMLSVKPLVCFLRNCHTPGADAEASADAPLDASRFFGKLNPGETSSMFSVPLAELAHQLTSREAECDRYESKIVPWGGLSWKINHFYYPVDNPRDVSWLHTMRDLSSDDSSDEGAHTTKCRDLWGLTAKILIDVSTVALGEQLSPTGASIPAGEGRDRSLGHEELIYGLHDRAGQFQRSARSSWETQMIRGDPTAQFSDVFDAAFLAQLQQEHGDSLVF
ncbi:8-oxo-dGTP diphosphatase KNAG_0A02770 [Huiozyma naganishii CBS 8797]|uniref:Nudix hydrolase domain-containing protein n=1 Tax=Huiozyma naganishii (strain ATCC MYA-139 / BCRC 22969 / CBS 8797 / KCTC 17520 / NBRC 10181 / NCYC 3082 / Yp74L-3) TaxID=1071383 RepID=J7S3H1_HUIN7|nr:hypothetical protein KNAG_0A02770 [Kazachstania naganishii CBS 8797]CCK67966.1 hypothetical protein KNAG_0A02770 [Kazachstania naganishii CBS 8797]